MLYQAKDAIDTGELTVALALSEDMAVLLSELKVCANSTLTGISQSWRTHHIFSDQFEPHPANVTILTSRLTLSQLIQAWGPVVSSSPIHNRAGTYTPCGDSMFMGANGVYIYGGNFNIITPQADTVGGLTGPCNSLLIINS